MPGVMISANTAKRIQVISIEGKVAERYFAVTSEAPRNTVDVRIIAMILTSTVFLGVSDVTAKYLSATLPSIEITWIRFAVFALIMTPGMVPGSPFYALRSDRPRLQVMRGVTLLGSSLLFITGLRY